MQFMISGKLTKFSLLLTQQYLLVTLITLFTLFIMIFAPETNSLFRYQAIEVYQGEWWRLFTANLCHSNWNHWLLNIAGFWMMDIFYRPVLSQKTRAYLMLFCMIINVLLLHWFVDLTWYVGLSGALHGYLVGGALLSWKSAIKINFIIIVIVTVKLIVELHWHINETTESLIGANVVEESHAFGAISAILFCLLFWLKQKLRSLGANP